MWRASLLLNRKFRLSNRKNACFISVFKSFVRTLAMINNCTFTILFIMLKRKYFTADIFLITF